MFSLSLYDFPFLPIPLPFLSLSFSLEWYSLSKNKQKKVSQYICVVPPPPYLPTFFSDSPILPPFFPLSLFLLLLLLSLSNDIGSVECWRRTRDVTNVCELWFWSPSVLQACGAVRWSGLKVKNSFRPFPNHGRNVGTKIAFRRAGGERWRRKSGFGVYWNVMESFKGVTERILKGGGICSGW